MPKRALYAVTESNLVPLGTKLVTHELKKTILNSLNIQLRKPFLALQHMLSRFLLVF